MFKKLIILAAAILMLTTPAFTMAKTITPKGQSVPTELTLISKFANNASGDLEYIGKADPGTATDKAGWFIQKIIYDANGDMTGILNANGQADFDKIWDNRESYTYE